MDPRERLIVALDVSSVDAAQAMVARLGDAVTFYKIGYQLGFAGGLDYARKLRQSGKHIFVDMKLHDIGNTVAAGVKSVAGLGANFLTVHAYPHVMQAAVAAREHNLRILAVSVLTSLNDTDLKEAGYAATVAELAARLGKPVAFATDCVGQEAEKAVAALKDGEYLLLENTRFHAGEEKNDEVFLDRLAVLGDVYVNDAFGTAHRAHASTVGVTQFLHERAAGFLMLRELEALQAVTESPAHPYVLILGGAKVSDKIGVIKTMLARVNLVLIGGAMAYTFMRARGLPVGRLGRVRW